MKITKQSNRSTRMGFSALEMADAVEMMKGEEMAKTIGKVREQCQGLPPSLRRELLRRLPQLLFGGVFRKNKPAQYNGCVTLEIAPLVSQEEICNARNSLSQFPATMLAMENAESKGVVAVVRYTRPDGTLPEDEKAAEIFHTHAYRHALKTIEAELRLAIAIKEPSIRQSVAISYDKDIYYNPNATVLLLEQPVGMPTESLYQEQYEKLVPEVAKSKSLSELKSNVSKMFEAALMQGIQQCAGYCAMGDFKPLLVYLAEKCHKAKVGEEECARWCMLHLSYLLDEQEIRLTVANAYALRGDFEGEPTWNKYQMQAFMLDRFMRRRYELRYNTMLGAPEYRENSTFCFDFRPLNKEVKFSMAINAAEEGLFAYDRDIDRYVHSDRVPHFSPIEHYMDGDNLPIWDGKDRIRPLLERVPTRNLRWVELGRRWLLSMVAHWLGRDADHGNALSPLLVGDQGCGKSTFCLNILPPELRQYYTDGIDLSKRRDCEQALTRFALINLDEFDQVSQRYQGFLKYLQQTASVNTRRPYGATIETLKRYASFIATSNHTDLLNDPSGSRRFICVKVEGNIDNGQPIDHKQLYAQVKYLLDSGERYWLTREEEQELIDSNEAFRQRPLAEDLFYKYYRAAQPDEDCLKMTSGEIYHSLKQKSHFDLPPGKQSHFGRFLSKKVQLQKNSCRGTQYCVVEIE